jgi:hypothetical protein
MGFIDDVLCEVMGCIHMAQDGVQRWNLINTSITLGFLETREIP